MNQLSVPVLVREMKFEEVADTVRLFSAQGLHDSVSVVQSYYESDPASFAVAIDIVNKRVIGGCGAPRTTHNTSFLGCYVVESGFQGFGIGKSMFQKCLKNVGDRNCGLSAVPEKFGIYKDKAGFKVEEGVSMVIFQGIPKMDSIKTADKLDSKYIIEKINLDSNKELIKNLINFDATVHLDNRDKLLRLEISKKDTITLVVREKNTNNVVGYGCVRPDYIERAMIGPLYAIDQEDIGEILLGELIRSVEERAMSKGVFAVSTTKSADKMRLCSEVLALPELTRCAKLYTKFVPPFNYANHFLCHTPDFSN